MSKVAVNNVSRTITVSAIGKQGVPGPQGDVTPEAVLALAGAETAARLAGEAAQNTALDRIASQRLRTQTTPPRIASLSAMPARRCRRIERRRRQVH